jgi:Phage portal protein, SPP1 Gp6-like
MEPLVPLTPNWWVSRLYKQLMDRKKFIDYFGRYYEGDFDLPWLAPQAQPEFRRILRMTNSNYMGLVVDAMVERMNLIGFRRASQTEGSADKDLWRIWQYNRMDGFYDQGLLEAAIGGCFYLLVAPNPKDEKNPFIWAEHPNQCIVEHVPGSNRRERAAGLKAWIDEWTGMVYATLYLPNTIWKFQAKDAEASMNSETPPGERQLNLLQQQWDPRYVKGEAWPARNPLGVVSMIESPNNPRLLHGGRSELSDVTDIQDRISKTIADRLMTQDYGAFPIRGLSGWPKEDTTGTAQNPIDIGRTRLLTTDVAEAKNFQFDAAPLDPYSAAKREDVKDIASRTRTPAHYLLGEMSNVNGATLKASESGLVSKTVQRMSGHADPAEDTARLAAKAAGMSIPDDEKIEIMWDDPEFRTQAEKTDALVKMRQAVQLPRQVVFEKWGATPTEIERWETLLEKEREEAMQQDPAMMLADQYRKAVGGGMPKGMPGANGGAKAIPSNPPKALAASPNGLTK